MTNAENALLSLILSEWVRLIQMDPKQQRGEGFYQWKARAAYLSELPVYGLQVDPTWLGTSAAGRQSRSRALIGLERAGWIVRTTRHRRPCHVRPTDLAITAILAGCEDQVANEPPPEPAWVLEPKLLTSEETDLATTELSVLLADTDDKLDAMLDELNTGSEPPQ